MSQTFLDCYWVVSSSFQKASVPVVVVVVGGGGGAERGAAWFATVERHFPDTLLATLTIPASSQDSKEEFPWGTSPLETAAGSPPVARRMAYYFRPVAMGGRRNFLDGKARDAYYYCPYFWQYKILKRKNIMSDNSQIGRLRLQATRALQAWTPSKAGIPGHLDHERTRWQPNQASPEKHNNLQSIFE